MLPSGMAEVIFPRPFIPAAVLLPLVERETGLMLLLTRRTEGLREHPGQISFPGGRIDEHDDGPRAAALRETSEELGVPADMIEVAGFLPPQPVISGYAVAPVIGFLAARVPLRPDPGEVAEVIEVPLVFFLEPSNARLGLRRIGAFDLPVCEYQYGAHRIWGATANIIHSLAIKSF